MNQLSKNVLNVKFRKIWPINLKTEVDIGSTDSKKYAKTSDERFAVEQLKDPRGALESIQQKCQNAKCENKAIKSQDSQATADTKRACVNALKYFGEEETNKAMLRN